jgi:hypothetical protein
MTAAVPTSRLQTTALAAVVTLALGVVTAISSAAGPAEAAQRCDGVWVVVDASVLDGPVTSRCAPGAPQDGLAALEAAGHRHSSVPRFPGMVCTIDGRPDPCNGAPTEAYWSYWHADPGGTWRYSNRGAGAHRSDPGTVEGWAFGAGQPPRTAPPSNPPEPEPTSSPSPTPTRTTEPAPSPSPSSTARSQADPAPTASDQGGAAADAEVSGTDASGPAATEPEATEEAEEEAAARPAEDGTGGSEASLATPPPSPSKDPSPENAAEPRDDERTPVVLEERRPDDEVAIAAPGGDGGMAGLIAGSGLAAAIAGAGVVQARRRRREPNP